MPRKAAERSAIARLQDIFFLELCIFSEICANSEQLFRTAAGEDFECVLSRHGFYSLRDTLLAGPAP